MDDYLSVATDAARKAGEIQAKAFRGTLEVDHKAPTDLVTDVDRECETVINERLETAFPDHAVLGEEGGASANMEDATHRWIIDPLDGTTNFVHGIPHFCVSIGLEIEGRLEYGVIYDTPNGDLYTGSPDGATRNGDRITVSDTATLSDTLLGVDLGRTPVEDLIGQLGDLNTETRGFRRFGSAVTHFRMLAEGRLDGIVGIGYSPWDMAAGTVLVEAAGGRVTDPDGGEPGRELVASNGSLHEELLATVG